MLKDEPIDLPTGPRWLYKDQEYEIDERNAASLLGRGYAVLVVKNGKKEVMDRAVLEKMTVVQLRKIAEDNKVEDFHLLRKTDLLDVLCPPENEKPEESAKPVK
jgi:hypothetical protein